MPHTPRTASGPCPHCQTMWIAPRRPSWIRRVLAVLLGVLALTLTGCVVQPAAGPQPSAAEIATARQQLAGLAVREPRSMEDYSRSLFPHWSTVSGTCNTRETVLKEQGQDVRTGPDCSPTSGSWLSPYDGASWSNPSDVDIDHVVPLAEAWRSGAAEWTVAKRKLFANDLDDPQLIAVTDDLNQAKGDKPPDQWKPPLKSYWCTYATDWIAVKDAWALTATRPEVDALGDMLGTCPAGAP